MCKAIYWPDKTGEHGYRKAFVRLDDVEYFIALGAYPRVCDFPEEVKEKRKPGRPKKGN